MNVAFIPVRGGSKSIPLKNIKRIAGKPLIYWTAKAASECKYIDKVYIATDSDEIRQVVNELMIDKVEVIDRSEESASDTASTEFAMLEFAEKYDFDNIFLIQATSPLLIAEDLDKGYELFSDGQTDSVLSTVRQKRFCWNEEDSGYSVPVNYDYLNRPRRQEFDGYLVENGAFYITSKEALERTNCRISGRIKAYEMPEDTYFEIDEPSDWAIIEKLLEKRQRPVKEDLNCLNDIKLFLTDCDGCLTDGGMYYSENGDELKKFNTKDGMAFKLLKERGILTGIITGEDVQLNKRRADKLKVDIYEPGCNSKADTIRRICKEHNISLEQVVYIGDDINDIDVLRIVGFGCAPADCEEDIKCVASFVTKAKGGEGVIREVANLILQNIESS